MRSSSLSVLMHSSGFNHHVLDGVTLAKLRVACQDALAQAGELRHAALEREQQLITEVAQTKLERDSLSQVGFIPYCHCICPAQSWADPATQEFRDVHSTWKQLRAGQMNCAHPVEPVTMPYSRNKQRYIVFHFGTLHLGCQNALHCDCWLACRSTLCVRLIGFSMENCSSCSLSCRSRLQAQNKLG